MYKEEDSFLSNLRRKVENIYYDEVIYEDGVDSIMKNWLEYGFVKKDVLSDENLKAVRFIPRDHNRFSVICNNETEVVCHYKKEEKFFENFGFDFTCFDDFKNWLASDDYFNWIKENEVTVSVEVVNNKIYGSLIESYKNKIKEELFREVHNSQKVYNAQVLEKNRGGFIVNIKGLNAFLPGGLASANRIYNFDEYIGKNIMVMIEDYLKEGDIFIVSNKKYIQKILPEKINTLKFDKQYTGKITGCSTFGIFIEFEDVLTGLLSTLDMDSETKELFEKYGKEYFTAGKEINFYIKEIRKQNRIVLSQSLAPKVINIYEEFKNEFEDKYCIGSISNIDYNYGYFIKFNFRDKTLTGLLHKKNVDKGLQVSVGDNITVYVLKVDLDSNKIYLTIK